MLLGEKMNLYPNLLLNKVEEITLDILKKNKINALILDVDNTLIDYKKNLSNNVVEWAKNLKANGIKLYILSNTNFAKKPFKKGFLKVQSILKEEPSNIAVVGDQIFTDIIGGNRCNMFTILVEPIDRKEFWYTKWKRPIEDKIKNKYKNELTKEKK